MNWPLGVLRLLAFATCALLALVSSTTAGVRHPERLLAKDCAIYLRIDGFAAHQRLFDQTVIGQLLKDELRPLTDDLGRRLFDLLGPEQVKNQLLLGAPPKELIALQNAAKQLPLFMAALRDRGVVIGLERETKPESVIRNTFVFPQVNEKNRKAVFSGIHLFARWLEYNDVRQIEKHGRTVFYAKNGADDLAFWAEDEDIVLTFGTSAFEKTMEVARGKRPNLAQSELFQRVVQFNEFPTFARGFLQIKPLDACLFEDSFGKAQFSRDMTSLEMQFGFADTHITPNAHTEFRKQSN